MIYWIILAVWIIGMVIAAWRIAKWENDFKTKLAATVLWPLTLILYGIYWAHKKCR